MDIKEKEQYKAKMKKAEALGALEFQKVVFAAEKVKFKIAKKVFPNFMNHYDKYCEKTRKRYLKKAKTDEEAKNINRNITILKLETKKEFNQEKNRNYHMNSKSPTEIYDYLLMNKRIHENGIKKNIVVIGLSTVGVALGVTPLIILTIIELIDMGINFECINIQNYNIYRYKLLEDKLIQREERRLQKNIEEYGDVAKIVYEKMETTENTPSITEIIDSLQTKEQANKLKELLLKEKQERENTIIKQKQLRGNI